MDVEGGWAALPRGPRWAPEEIPGVGPAADAAQVQTAATKRTACLQGGVLKKCVQTQREQPTVAALVDCVLQAGQGRKAFGAEAVAHWMEELLSRASAHS